MTPQILVPKKKILNYFIIFKITNYNVTTTLGFYLDDATDRSKAFVFPNQPKQIGSELPGASFFDENCNVLGVVVPLPLVVINSMQAVEEIVKGEIDPRCLITIVPVEIACSTEF